MEVAKISNEFLGEDDLLAFGKIAFEGYDYVLLPLTDDEYQKASQVYLRLIDIFAQEVF